MVSRNHLVGLGAGVLAACAAGDPRFTTEDPAGFWFGLWHGLIAFITLVIGLFDDSVEVYERANSGGWYDLGFLLGASCWAGSAHQSHRTWRDGKAKRAGLPPGHGKGHLKVDVSWTSDEPAAKEPPAAPAAEDLPASPGSPEVAKPDAPAR